MRPSWFKISALLAGLWLVLGSVLWWLGERQPSPEKVVAFAAAHGVDGKAEAERGQMVQAVAAEYQRLDVDQRRELLLSQDLKPWWTALTLPERHTFRMAIFPQSLQLVEAFDRLEPQQRQKNVTRMLETLRKKTDGQFAPKLGPAIIASVTMTGLKPIFESTLFDDNMDYLLMFHELEKSFVWRR
jgi:hypothetical protein